jgi:SAM-dependent methyltransferase
VIEEQLRFGFGKNWADFVDAHFSEERIDKAQEHLLRFLCLNDLAGKTFLDIGCGSGLHSLAALRAGAERIVSFDYDSDSVATTKHLRTFSGEPANWNVLQGSVLDQAFMTSLDTADIVYSWGVLHHTGDLWRAVENAAIPMRPDGVFYIALYSSDVYLDPPPEYWLDVKRRYNLAGPWRRRWMEWQYAWRESIFPDLKNRRNPFKSIMGYAASRGMSYWTDVRDWLGGYPMEFAGNGETKIFCRDRLGLELINISAGEGNTEFLFRRRGAQNYWDKVTADTVLIDLEGPFLHRAGQAYQTEIPNYADTADDIQHPRRSRLMLYEDREPVGFAHQTHADIAHHGGGRYSHWQQSLIFSSTDGSDPNSNGRRYAIANDMLP